ncbi:hypothetical protein PSACC_03166 [Paramicrosporidium saccamoebae]|uniref:Uncharacterized protein n=1 Tax=Paramicrosporidium saccamoebae TaxID=1246581 RepID=A0A2H9THC1_9FUNG|nr:hypothetical protein PSACC_03166 [Paramicrosporidium saccamoebae]
MRHGVAIKHWNNVRHSVTRVNYDSTLKAYKFKYHWPFYLERTMSVQPALRRTPLQIQNVQTLWQPFSRDSSLGSAAAPSMSSQFWMIPFSIGWDTSNRQDAIGAQSRATPIVCADDWSSENAGKDGRRKVGLAKATFYKLNIQTGRETAQFMKLDLVWAVILGTVHSEACNGYPAANCNDYVIREFDGILDKDPQEFYFDGVGVEADRRFKLSGHPVIKVDITDGFNLGDSFIVYANNELAAVSPIPETRKDLFVPNYESARSDLRFSSAQIVLTKPCTLRIFTRAAPYGMGAGYIKARSVRTCDFAKFGFFLISTTLERHNADLACAAHGGALALIKDALDAKKARYVLDRCLGGEVQSAWIGSYKNHKEGPLSISSFPEYSGLRQGVVLADYSSRSLPVLCSI